MADTSPLSALAPISTGTAAPVKEMIGEETWTHYDERGVDLALLRDMLDLAPIDRLRRMERHARDIQALMTYGERHRATKAP